MQTGRGVGDNVARGISWGKRRGVVAVAAMALTVLGGVVAPVARATDPAPGAPWII
jgi:hypothetical protein